MNRAQYARYLVLRLAEAVAIASGAGLLALFLQRLGILAPLSWVPHAVQAWIPDSGRAVASIAWWSRPVIFGALAHLLLGPKQRRPVYLRIPGAMYAYAGIRVDRNAGCRGGCITGATGSGKTLSCIVPRLHSPVRQRIRDRASRLARQPRREGIPARAAGAPQPAR